jgi:simple sugar transport system permease protein
MLSSLQNKTKNFKTHEFYLLLVILVFILIVGVLTKGTFFTLENFADMMVGYSAYGIMAMGVLVVLISGDIDISFLAIATVAQYVMASYILTFDGNMILAFGIAILVGMLLGSVNAVFVHYLKVPAIIITIATMNIFFGLLMWVSDGKWLYNFPDWFSEKTPFTSNVIPLGGLLAAIILTHFLLRHTNIGRQIFAIGGNLEAAKRVGVKIFQIRLFAYSYVGIMAGIGATIQAYTVQNVAPNTLIGNEMQVLAMVVLGGASLVGGKGSAFGTLLGILLVAMMGNALVLLGVSSYWYNVFMGTVILVSFGMTAINFSKRRKGVTL